MSAVTIPASVTSRPHPMPAGSIVTVSPAAGASAIVEYTFAGASGIANGAATWTQWPKGTVTAETSDMVNNAMHVRVTAAGNSVTLAWNTDPSVSEKASFRADWLGSASPNPQRGNVQAAASHYPGSTNNSGATANRTWFHAISAWDDFHAVQLVFANSSAAPVTVEAVAVAASTTIYPGGVNNLATPQGGGAWSTPLQNLTVPAGAAQRTPGFFITPKIAVPSLPRAAGELDNGKYPLLLVKAYFNAGNATFSYSSLNTAMGGAAWDAVNEGFTLQTSSAGGDNVVAAPTGGGVLARASGPILTLVGVIFTYNRKVICICGIGDSIMQGYLDGVTNNCPFAFKATARIRAMGRPVSYLNGGIAGSTITEINQHGKDLISKASPDIVILPSFTPNSATNTQADWDAQWYNVMDLATAQLALGKQVVLLTPYPNNAFNTTINALRLKQRQRVIDSGLPYADIESALVDPAGLGNYKAGMNNDVTHPSPAGHEAIAAVLQPVLSQLI